MTKANQDSPTVIVHHLATIELLAFEFGNDLQLDQIEIEAVLAKIDRFANRKARKNKDFKILRGYTSECLFELRWNFQNHVKPIQLRLIAATCDNSRILLLIWHLKDPALNLEDQRQRQNAACEIAIERKRQIDPDCLST